MSKPKPDIQKLKEPVLANGWGFDVESKKMKLLVVPKSK